MYQCAHPMDIVQTFAAYVAVVLCRVLTRNAALPIGGCAVAEGYNSASLRLV
jgi:hypothetical protein